MRRTPPQLSLNQAPFDLEINEQQARFSDTDRHLRVKPVELVNKSSSNTTEAIESRRIQNSKSPHSSVDESTLNHAKVQRDSSLKS